MKPEYCGEYLVVIRLLKLEVPAEVPSIPANVNTDMSSESDMETKSCHEIFVTIMEYTE